MDALSSKELPVDESIWSRSGGRHRCLGCGFYKDGIEQIHEHVPRGL